ncbi:hypothetical protein PMAYCL1PPCAC_20888, partial [Pristionchus mayeri]
LQPLFSWGSLPWPAVNRICYHLYNPDNCSDLANLSQVSTHYLAGVNTFMNRDGNRPGVNHLTIINWQDGLEVQIELIPSNFRFYGLKDLGLRRFLRRGRSNYPELHLKSNGTEDLIFEKISSLLSASIQKVYISGNYLSPEDYSLFAQLLRSSKIEYLEIPIYRVDDTPAVSIIEIASRTKAIALFMRKGQLSDPASFIEQLDSLKLSSVRIKEHMFSLIGLPPSFWENFFNE